MRRFVFMVMVMSTIIILGSRVSGAAQAQTAEPTPTIPLTATAPTPLAPITLNYRDSSGPGTVTIVNQGDDAVTGGSAIRVTIMQNGVAYQGQGLSWKPDGRTSLLSFYLSDPQGNAFFFTGKLTMGVDALSGQGSYQLIQNPVVTDQWTMGRIFPGPGPVATDVTIDESQNGQDVQVQPGSKIKVVLHSTYWNFQPVSNPAVLDQVSEPVYAPDPSVHIPGTGAGTVTVEYTVKAAGTTDISASRESCGEALRCQDSQKSFDVTVTVSNP